jgi:lipid-A-disaccharide synthase
VAPTVWAWREYRAKKFAKLFDEIFILFNFENSYFSKFKLKTTFIGHPIFYIENRNKIKKDNYIAFLFGSRLSEVKKLFNFFQIAYEQLVIINPDITIFIPTLPHLEKIISVYVDRWKIKTIITTDKILIEKYYLISKFALVCSGTASLEIAKRKIPQLVIYKLNFLTEIILKKFVKVRYANIINIIANKMIVPELTNSSLTKKKFIKYFVNLITDFDSNEKQIIAINSYLKQLESNQPPFTIAAKKIDEYLQ